MELIPSDQRTVRNEAFIEAWENRLYKPPGLEYLTITSRLGGHPGRALEIRLSGQDAEALKRAALELADTLAGVPGIQGIEDDMPYGQQQLVYRLSPLGESLGLSVEDVGRQLRAAFDGQLAQIFNEGDDETAALCVGAVRGMRDRSPDMLVPSEMLGLYDPGSGVRERLGERFDVLFEAGRVMDPEEVFLAHQSGVIATQAPIQLRYTGQLVDLVAQGGPLNLHPG